MLGSSIGLGHQPFTLVRWVRFPYRAPYKCFLSSYTGTTLNSLILQNGERCQEELGYRGFKRHREHLYGKELCPDGGIGRHAGLRSQCASVRVRVSLGAPSYRGLEKRYLRSLISSSRWFESIIRNQI